MKIGFICQKFVAVGGAERYLAGLMDAFVQRGHEVHIFANRWEGTPGATWHRVPMIRGLSFLKILSFAWFCRRELRRFPCDVVFSIERTLQQDIFCAQGACHREYLQQRRRFLPRWYRPTLRINPLHIAMLWLEHHTFSPHRTRHVIAISHRGKAEIMRHYSFPADRIHVIYNGIDCNRFRRLAQSDRSHEPTFQLLFVGTGFERKGLAFAIRALAKLPPHVSLLIVGKGNRTPYEQLARKLAVANRIRFAGTSNDMTAIYNAADLLVHPAIYEPFGLVCAEALACGLPVVTTLVTGAAELITPGINGNIVDDPSDSAALAAAIQPFLNRHNVAETALAARRAAESVEFSSTLEQTLTLLEQFLSANHSAPNPAGD